MCIVIFYFVSLFCHEEYYATFSQKGVCCVSIMSANLTHWGQVTHNCVSNLTIIGSDNGLLLGQRQAIIQTNVGILIMWTLGTNFSEILIEIHIFSHKKYIWKCFLWNDGNFVSAPNVLTHASCNLVNIG